MSIASAAILLFLVIDPLGNIPLFVASLRTVPEARRTRVVLRELLIALAILTLFLFIGAHLLSLLQISAPALRIAGALVLFLIALRMVFPAAQNLQAEQIRGEPFIVPLAIPYIAGPSALATVMLLMSRDPARWADWLLALCAAWLASALILLLGARLSDFFGERGLLALERLMGMLLVAVAVQSFLEALHSAFPGTGG